MDKCPSVSVPEKFSLILGDNDLGEMEGRVNCPGMKSQLNDNSGQSESEGIWTNVACNHRARRQGPSRIFQLTYPLSPLVTKSCSFYLLFIIEPRIILFNHYTPAVIQVFTCSHLALLPISHCALLLGSQWGSMNSTTLSHPGPKQIKLMIKKKKKEWQTEKKNSTFISGNSIQRLWF